VTRSSSTLISSFSISILILTPDKLRDEDALLIVDHAEDFLSPLVVNPS